MNQVKIDNIKLADISENIRLEKKCLHQGTPFSMTNFVLSPNTTTPIDCHQEREIWFIQSGNGRLVCDEETYDLGPGDSVQFSAWQKHSIHNTGQSNLSIVSMYWLEHEK